jgi:hypothetical protein
MKKILLSLFGLVCATGLAAAADNVFYTATADPGLSPDGMNQNSTPADVWQVGLSATGGSGSYFGTFGDLANSWYIYSFPMGGAKGSVDALHTFDGGALSIGQTVSLSFLNRTAAAGGSIGLSLMGGSSSLITFSWTAGDSVYRYTDAGVSGQSTGFNWEYQNAFDLSFTLTGSATYSASVSDGVTTANWTGAYSGPITGIDIFNNVGGNNSDVGFNNLAVTPEPSTWALLATGGALLLGFRRRLAVGRKARV